MIRSLVEDLDGDIVECADGTEAISACVVHHPEWVLMDVSMRPMDGLTATRKIKRFLPETKIVIVTDHTDAKTRQAAIDAGANGFCGKQDLMPLRRLIGEH
ncbi:MAG: response regulator transcription factor [Acidobacteria bacterium]|nr:response regulator transcription factor [Acidobacteriota bacterium]